MKMSDTFALPVYSGTQDVTIHNKEKPCVVSGTSTVLVARPKYIEATICAINNHDRLTEENAKLRQEKENLLHELCAIQNACIGEIAMGYNLDAESIGRDISIVTGMTNPELNELLNQLKDQKNDK